MATKPESNELVLNKNMMSWRDTKRSLLLAAKMEREDVSLEEAEAAMNEIQSIIAKCIVSIPNAWIVPDAPLDLDWSKGESLDYLVSHRMEALRDELNGNTEKN